jgi:hypothetical protein
MPAASPVILIRGAFQTALHTEPGINKRLISGHFERPQDGPGFLGISAGG